MSCPHCDAATVAFAVPPALREQAPASLTAICTRCLRTVPAADVATDEQPVDDASPDERSGDASPDLSAVDPAFPNGEAGVALALACGHLESLALNRASIEALVGHPERSGAGAFAFFERLDAADAAFDLERRRSALLDMV